MSISLMLVVICAFITPMILARFKLSLLPNSVAEILVGIIIGKSFLNLIQIDDILTEMSTFGVIILLFLSGMEIDFSLFQKNNGPKTPLEEKNADAKISPVKVALLAYGLSLLTALGLALLFKWTGLFTNVPLATILFATVALGVVISVLKENELLAKPLGQTLLLIAVLGEVVPLLALTIYSSLVSGRGGSIWLIGLLFIAGALMLRHFRWFFPALSKFNKATTQVDMRLAFAIIFSLVVLAEHVGAENILGAFVAGIVIKLLKPSHATEEKLDAIGYGFLIPFFFILTGAKLNIPSLLADRQTLILIPLFFAAYVIAKLPAFLGLKMRFNTRNAFAGTLLSSTTITLVLAVLTVAQDLKVITTQQASAFILAGILTCLAGPLAFNKLRILEADDFKKTIVHFLGTNIVTVNASKRLNTDLYDINFYTNLKENFNTYNYLQNVHFLPGLNVDKLIADKVFDADILVLGYANANQNVRLALAAKAYGIQRVICVLDNNDPKSMAHMEETLAQADIEVFNPFDTRVGMLSAVITTPSMLNVLTGNARIYEIVVKNAKFAGVPLSRLPFINDITVSRIYRNHKAISPHGATKIELGDHILFSCDKDILLKVNSILSKLNE
ncbi:transporter, CPA2 family [Ligilactobacillus sp. WC1T17]|uniref:Transporter, CPA2 family n=1 Tax=Ligilactobacillus ruminis TaxID=1623 RepID=A0ABY1ACL5_9LACO|nr:transporter, CPA2 family [Ligilactobacillus ruminis]